MSDVNDKKKQNKSQNPIETKLRRFSYELFTIVIGILLGLWLSGWQSNKQDQDFVEKSVVVIIDELSRNFESVEQSREYHLKLLPDLINARDAARVGTEAPGFDYRGFGTAQTSTAAYQTALSAGVFAKLDPKYSAQIADAYLKLSAVKETDNRYKSSLSIRQNDFLEIMPFAFSDLLYVEDDALQAISLLTDKKAPKQWLEETPARPY